MSARRRSPPARRLKSLRETLAYRNDQVVYKFMERYQLTSREARDIFSEALKWMWLCARAEREPSAPKPLTLIGLRQMTIIDEMWHTFVLFTPVYEAFCHRYLGFFLHHMPYTRESQQRQEALRRADPEGYEQRTLAKLRQELAFVGQELGPTTLRKWFTTYGRKYTPERMDHLRLPHWTPAPEKRAARR